jgi:hypothetical protein
VLDLNDWNWRTSVQNNCGPNATWSGLEGVVTDVHGDTLKFERMKVAVYDNNTLSDSLLGEGTASLRKCGSNIDEDVVMTVHVTDKENNRTGVVELTLQVNESAETLAAKDGSISENLPKTGFLEVMEITLSNLKNTGNSF